MRAATLALGMLSLAREAYKLAPGDSWVSILYGNILFYMPGIFGGDKEEGLECYRTSSPEYGKGYFDQRASLALCTIVGDHRGGL